MAFEYIGVDRAIEAPGLRMVVVGDVPSGWGEAAKGVFHVKGISWSAVRRDYGDPRLKSWARGVSGPIAVHADERPRSGWAEILLLAERLAPTPALLPDDPAQRALLCGLSHELCGEGGLGWARRLQLVPLGLQGEGGFPDPIANYLGRKYGYRAQDGASWSRRGARLLRMLGERLHTQRSKGSRYYIGDGLTAVDIYSATFIAMFAPLPPDQCAMDPTIRQAFETRESETEAALDPILLQHRDLMYARHLELPLSL